MRWCRIVRFWSAPARAAKQPQRRRFGTGGQRGGFHHWRVDGAAPSATPFVRGLDGGPYVIGRVVLFGGFPVTVPLAHIWQGARFSAAHVVDPSLAVSPSMRPGFRTLGGRAKQIR